MTVMPYLNHIGHKLCAVWLGLIMSGAAPAFSGPSSASRDPYFMLGESRMNTTDYRKAIQDFERALLAHPRLAAAHFELGWIYDRQLSEPAMAIYHYERYLKLAPNAGNAEVVRQRIEDCKRVLARQVFGLPTTSTDEHTIEELVAQRQQLLDKIHRLQAQANKWSAFCAALQKDQRRATPPAAGKSQPAIPSQERIHRVVAGETVAGIARHYHVPLATLLAANPGLKPRQMAVGTILTIPP